jgi:hypothetical protein
VGFEDLLGRLEPDISPASLRDLAAKLLRLADCVEQGWGPERTRLNYPVFSKAARIERKAVPLSFSVAKEERRAAIRDQEIGADIVGAPAWNILLELFKQFAGGAKVSTKSLQLTAGCPETTALRIIDRLESRGLVARLHSDTDRRVTFISLTRDGGGKGRFGSRTARRIGRCRVKRDI